MNYYDTLMWKELNQAPEILKTLAEKNANAIAAIVKAVNVANVNNVYTVARGTSDHAMIYFKYITETMLNLPVASGAPSVVTMYKSKLNLSNSLVVACSQSGKAADVIEVVKRANECGAVTVAITNDEASPLANVAKYHLCCFCEEEKSVAATKTFSAQLFLSFMLVNALSENKENLSEISALLKNSVLDINEQTDKLYKAFSGAKECFVLSRGISSAIAFECALKLQETCYIKARAYHSSDFYHGPMAMIEKGSKVILFAAKSENVDHQGDYIKCADKMIELGADLYVVTDDELAFKDKNATIVRVSSGKDERYTVFNFALVAQMLACKVSCFKGLNPDSPRALKKVTITK